jgi:N-terminal domain of galactosyltransferase
MSVLVLGMHRSGTSAVTRVVSLLGPSLCRPEDLLRGHDGNPRGHWECAPLVAHNEALLERLGARWWCPPDSGAQVAALADDASLAEEARRTFLASHPDQPSLAKDPRLCLTLSFWRRVLPEPPAIIWVLRHPVAVAASMRARDGIAEPFGRAVWERHMSLAAEATAGLPVWLTEYTDVIRDPLAWADQAATFLRANGVAAEVPTDPVGIQAFVRRDATGLDRDREDSDDLLSPAQRELWHALRGDDLAQLPEPDPATIELMSEVRTAFALHLPTARPAGGSFVSSTGIRVLDAAGPRVAAASRAGTVSVLLLPRGGPASLAQAQALRPFLPGDAEIVTVADPSDGPPTAEQPDWFVTVRRDGVRSLAQRLNLAVEVARGDHLVVLAGPPVRPQRGWLPALRAALGRPDCAVAAPALHPEDGGEPAYGLEPDPLFLDAKWVGGQPAGPAFAVPAASIAAFATTRDAFQVVGGFDEGLTGAGCEDIEYCLRLWRAGWRCLAVPAARVRMRFETLPADEIDVVTNTLRTGLVHLSEAAAADLLAALSAMPCFPEALSRVAVADAGRRRRTVDALSWYRTEDLDCLGMRSASG